MRFRITKSVVFSVPSNASFLEVVYFGEKAMRDQQAAKYEKTDELQEWREYNERKVKK